MNAKQKTSGRQIFVLTPEEKKTIVFVLSALILGAATKYYRDTHPHSPRPPTVKEQRAAKKAAHSKHISPSPTPAITMPEEREG